MWKWKRKERKNYALIGKEREKGGRKKKISKGMKDKKKGRKQR